MRNRKMVLLIALPILISSAVSLAQTSAKKKTAADASVGIEPLRVINGEMRGRTVTGQFRQGARAMDFSFTITKADLVNGRLHLTGDFSLGGSQAREKVTGTIAGVMANVANPWPSAREAKKSKEEEKRAAEQQQGRETKKPEATGQLGQLAQSTQDTARKTPSAPGEKTEQTQSLYAQAEANTGCGAIFLRLTLPERLRARMERVAEPLQLGFVLKPFDNERGEEINRAICRMLQTREAGIQASSLNELNRLLASSN